MKWLARLAGSEAKSRTPLPPKPYKDTIHNPIKYATDPRYYDQNDLSITDHDKPHWQDPRFQSKEKTPFFDFFGYNRDWGNTLFKIGFLTFVLGMIIEGNMFLNYQDSSFADRNSLSLAKPFFSQPDEATEAELKAAGFAVVGARDLSSMVPK